MHSIVCAFWEVLNGLWVEVAECELILRVQAMYVPKVPRLASVKVPKLRLI